MRQQVIDTLSGIAKAAGDQDVPHAEVTIDWSPLEKIVQKQISGIYKDSAASVSKAIGSRPFDKLNEAAARYARNRSASLIKDLNNTTLDRIRVAEEAAFREGMTPKQLGDAITEIIDDPARAERIARTEMADAQSVSAFDAALESGLADRKVWLVAADPCPICQENSDAGEIGIEDEFPSGDLTPTAHPHCNCDFAVILREVA